MPNCLWTLVLESLVLITLMALPTSGVPWKTRTANVPRKFLEVTANSNPHNYSMILNSPDFCEEEEEVFLLILVRSIRNNYIRRQSIRKTWGSSNEIQGKKLKVAFLFGRHDPVLNKHLEEEHTKYHDILQESFQESYKTLTMKTVMAWKWAMTFCSKSVFVIVCNDELFVDIFKTVSYLKGIVANKQHETFYGCWMEREGIPPNRNLKHKHGVSWDDYPGKRYPAFCNGNGYVVAMPIIRKLYEISLKTPPFMPDDAWCGVLAAKLTLVISNIQNEIPISTKYKIIEHYISLDKYVKAKMLFFPLDRKFSDCEMCAAHYLWQQVTLYNNYSQPALKRVEVPLKWNQFSSNVPLFFYVSVIFNIIIAIGFFFFKNKKILYLFIFNSLILIQIFIVGNAISPINKILS